MGVAAVDAENVDSMMDAVDDDVSRFLHGDPDFEPVFAAPPTPKWTALKSADAADASISKVDYVVDLTAETFKEQVVDANMDVLVYIYAPWCSHCQQFAPAFE